MIISLLFPATKILLNKLKLELCCLEYFSCRNVFLVSNFRRIKTSQNKNKFLFYRVTPEEKSAPEELVQLVEKKENEHDYL